MHIENTMLKTERKYALSATLVLAVVLVCSQVSTKPVRGAEEAPATFDVRGRVVNPEGQPVAGASIYVSDRWDRTTEIASAKGGRSAPERTKTGADGSYQFSATKLDMDQHLNVVAVADGLGPDWVPLTRANRGGGLHDLRLVTDDVPLAGRVLDLESQPVSGATVEVQRILKAPGENLWPYFGAWSRDAVYRRQAKPRGYEESIMSSLEIVEAVKTGADGQFKVYGFGQNRVVVLAIEAPGLERRVVEVVTRFNVPKGVPVVRAAKADYLLAPGKPISGVVRDKATGQPVPGVQVESGNPQSLEFVRATTDAEGRYKLLGVSKKNSYGLIAQSGPYIRSLLFVNDTPGAEPITADFELQRGLEVQGRLIDKTTGRPVRGYVEYCPLVDNPNLAEFPSFTKLRIEDLEFSTRLDGSFSVPVLPGRGVISAHSWENRFTNGHSWPAASSNVVPFHWGIESYHALVEIDASENNPQSLKCEIALDPGRTLTGTVVGPDGEPLTGSLAWGVRPAFDAYELDIGLPILRSASFTATGLDDRNPRYLLFWHKEKELARAMLVWGDERGPLTVRLEPLGTVHGCLTNPDGMPLAGVTVDSDWYPSTSRIFRQTSGLALGNHLQELHWVRATTDSEGRFQLPRLIPGFSYSLRAFGGFIAQDLLAPTGRPKDLGTIKLAVDRPETKKP